jgi:hypothetical protein
MLNIEQGYLDRYRAALLFRNSHTRNPSDLSLAAQAPSDKSLRRNKTMGIRPPLFKGGLVWTGAVRLRRT